MRLRLVKLLLLDAGLELILVLECLTLHLLLTRDAFLISLATLLSHSLFLLQLRPVTLQFELHLVLGRPLVHLLLVLDRLTLLLLLNLSLLDLQLSIEGEIRDGLGALMPIMCTYSLLSWSSKCLVSSFLTEISKAALELALESKYLAA